jgi:hypothetical protein
VRGGADRGAVAQPHPPARVHVGEYPQLLERLRSVRSGEGRAIWCTWSKQRTTARRSGPQGAGAVGQPTLSVVTRIVGAAHWCFCDPHMQEPNIPPLFQTLPKAESPLSFLETKRSAGAYKSYSRNQSRQNAMISGGLLKLNRAILLYIYRVEKTGD